MMKKNGIQLPRKIRLVILRKKAIKIIAFLLSIFILTMVSVLFGEQLIPMSKENKVIGQVCYVFFFICCIGITKVYRVFTDSDYIGTVKSVKITTGVGSKSIIPYRETWYTKSEANLIIETPSGKTIHKRARELPSKYTSNIDMYKVGDEVIHLHGTGITVVLPSASDTYCFCVMCGRPNNISADECENCALPLIKMSNYHKH